MSSPRSPDGADLDDAARSPYTFDFHLLRDPETLNAFALPGGQVFISFGLLSRSHDETQLAGVLGHERGHVVNRHAAEHMATGQPGQLLTMAAGVAATDEDGHGQRAAEVAAMINQMVQLKYSPAAMLGVMRILADASQGGRGPALLSTHPYPEQRLKAIERYLAVWKEGQ